MIKLEEPLASYVEVCLPVVGKRRRYPAVSDPKRQHFAAAVRDAIAAYGWPPTLSELFALQRSAESVLDEGSLEGTPTNVALTGIELACNERMATEPIRSDADCRAKLAWLQFELLGSAANLDWIKALEDALAWLDPQEDR